MSELVFVEQAPDQGKRYELHDGATIGREGCDVTLSDSEVSRHQARVTSADDAAVIEDLGSTNGTFVNGERIAGAHALTDGDEVRFGSTVWRFEAAAAARREAPPPQAAPPQAPPADVQPSVIRRTAPPAGAPAGFTPAGSTRPKRSAATRMSATVSATIVVALTWAGVVLYYVTEPFK